MHHGLGLSSKVALKSQKETKKDIGSILHVGSSHCLEVASSVEVDKDPDANVDADVCDDTDVGADADDFFGTETRNRFWPSNIFLPYLEFSDFLHFIKTVIRAEPKERKGSNIAFLFFSRGFQIN